MTNATRRRRVELVRESSDLRRFRGFFPAALAGALALVAALLGGVGPRNLLAPAPLTPAHAALACASCHGTPSPQDACTSCHGARPSQRSGHRELTANRELGCATCHSLHGGEGLAFAPDARVKFYAAGLEHELGRFPGAPTGSGALVPLVREQACATCHRLDAPRDPAAHCFSGRDGDGFALCFDEHRKTAASGAGQPPERDAAVEAARVVARTRKLALASFVANAGWSAGYVLAGVGVGLTVLGFAARRARRRAHSPGVRIAANGVKRLPVIDTSRCLGCEACVDACPYDALEVRRYVAVLARPDDCCGAGPCQESCPNGSLTLRSDGAALPGPELSPEFECPERPGLFVAGDASGGSLIRNAVRQGVAVAQTLAARAGARARDSGCFDLIVVGAGPAGLAAALTARARGLRVLVLEQASVAESIRRFSRGKLVLDAKGADEPELPLFLADATKEELLNRWLRSVRRARLELQERARVIDVASGGTHASPEYRVRVAGQPEEREYRARNVLLAVGSRGTPRQLPVPVPGTLEARVHYELSDARAFAGKRAVVIGLGDVAMETALALAAQPGTEVSVVHRGDGFRRGKQRNIDALSAAVARGRVEILFRAEVERFDAEGGLWVRVAGERRRLPFDAVFVHIGALPAGDLLSRTGVRSRG